jgi:hypothetical protein
VTVDGGERATRDDHAPSNGSTLNVSKGRDMQALKRIGPPVPTGVRGDEYDLSVPLNGTPSVDWRRAFHASEKSTELCHPTRVTVKDRALTFTSEDAHVQMWIQLIDEWIAGANQTCAERPTSAARREGEQSEDERERQRRIREAVERFKNL